MLPARPLPRRLIRPLSAPFLHPDSSLLDAAGGFTATIDWGDGTATPGTVNGSNGNFTVTGSHTYDEGNFTPTVVVGAHRGPDPARGGGRHRHGQRNRC